MKQPGVSIGRIRSNEEIRHPKGFLSKSRTTILDYRMAEFTVIASVSRAFPIRLAHVPELVRFGSKPIRELRGNPALGRRIGSTSA